MRNSGLELEEVDYGKTGLTVETVLALVAKAGSVAAVLNTRHATAKAKGWVVAPPSATEFAKAVVSEVNLLRRPILIDGEKIIIGFDRPAYEAIARRAKP